MRFTLIVAILIFLCGFTHAQTKAESKFGASLKLYLSSNVKDKRFITSVNGQDYIAVFIELQEGADYQSIGKTGIRIRTQTGSISTADIPLAHIMAIAENPAIRKIELPLLFSKTDTLMKKLVTVDRIHKGDQPLGRSFTGKNTLIGVLDDGIDFTHPDFYDSAGNLRIKSIWNMDYAGVAPAGFNYGHEWVKDSLQHYAIKIANKSLPHYEIQKMFGGAFHGTSVTGLAAGKNGIATGADIVVVSLFTFADTVLRSDRVIDGIAYIYSKAKEAGKKCVVNLSFGVQDGAPHDGNSMVERAIDAFCEKKPDILVSVSAGNNGNSWKHWSAKPVHKDSSFGFFRCAYEGKMYFSIPNKYSDSLRVSLTDSKLKNLSDPNIDRDSILGQTPYFKISDLIKQLTPASYTTHFKNGVGSSRITFSAAHANSDYDELIVKVEEFSSGSSGLPFDDHLYRFIFKGKGELHGWMPFMNLHPIYFFGNNPYPNESTYITTDNSFTTNIPSHAFTVLSSGAYNARDCYYSPIHNDVVRTYPGCQLTYFTSHGPTQDGRIKPDIISPGENIITSRSRFDDFLGHHFIIDSSTQAFTGTSASSPITAGIVALLWEYNPEYSREDIIHRIKSTAYGDAYTQTTGALPNNISGWGKIDAFKAMTDSSTDMQKVCSIREICQERYIEPPPNPMQPDFFYMKFYPNPVSGTVYINYRSSVIFNLVIYSSTGQRMMQIPVMPDLRGVTKTIDLSRLASGIYFVRAVGDGISVTKKIMVTR
ncbi:S8/S53 family peptidase [Pollutibacter soli]|uniref:S8/S53 family peptidase n=1 Tax=Pollutibacter soli TaxID=3034157 RepID=UPI0030138AAF